MHSLLVRLNLFTLIYFIHYKQENSMYNLRKLFKTLELLRGT